MHVMYREGEARVTVIQGVTFTAQIQTLFRVLLTQIKNFSFYFYFYYAIYFCYYL